MARTLVDVGAVRLFACLLALLLLAIGGSGSLALARCLLGSLGALRLSGRLGGGGGRGLASGGCGLRNGVSIQFDKGVLCIVHKPILRGKGRLYTL